jgi:branched-chain amino acid aminotransferase
VYITLPCSLTELAREVHELLGQADNPESMIRIMLTRGIGPLGLDPDLAEHPTRVILVAPLRSLPAESYTNGVGVVTFRTQRLADATDAAGAKIGNYLVAILAMREAKKHAAIEALVIDAQERVVEGTSSNLFAVMDGSLITPPETSGILPGITRARVLQLAKEHAIPVEFRAPTLVELCAASEVFISSTIREIVPVVRIDDRTIGGGKPGPTTELLLRAFRGAETARRRS